MVNPESIGEIFNVAGGNKISIKELIQVLKKTLNKYPDEIYTGHSWKGDIKKLWADTSKIRLKLGWNPEVTIEQGILKYIHWLSTHEEN
jgi:nucleoside-diphosphate-sugar epimerase